MKTALFVTVMFSPDIRELKQGLRRQRERQKSDRFVLAKFSMDLLRSFP